ncbi:hypothetical protein BU17DRAFT_86611 [Hysterangium stoloniferum]|nr:hypothetical protein BU17DRAFT_86611 [Hysterangium stoloniferum]
MGVPARLSLEPAGMQDDEAIRGAKAWYRESKYSHPDNVHLVAYAELLKKVSRFHKSTHTPKTLPSVHLVQKQQQPSGTSHDMDTSSQGHAFPSTSGHISPVSDLAQLPHTPTSSSAQSGLNRNRFDEGLGVRDSRGRGMYNGL